MKVVHVAAAGGPPHGVLTHARRLAEAQRALGHDAQVTDPAGAIAAEPGAPDLYHLHWVPFLYPPLWGAGGALLARRLARRARLVVTIHEPRTRLRLRPREVVLAAVQAAALNAVTAAASGIIVATSEWAGFLNRPAAVIPSGSPLPPGPHSTSPAGGRPPVIATVYSGHPGRLLDLAAEAAAEAARRSGGTAVRLGGPAPADHLSDAGFAARLGATQLVLLPYLDGASARRTSLAAALQLGRPVLTTRTAVTAELPDPGTAFATVPAGDRQAFIEAAAGLAADPERRRDLGAAAAAAFERHLSWPHLAGRVEAVYNETPQLHAFAP